MWYMNLAFLLWLFAMGCVVGSFLNVCIYRIPWQKSVIWPGSHCPNCLSAIRARDNIPIASWLLLGGACRSCRQRISARYPLIEGFVGLGFVAIAGTDVLSGAVPWFSGNPFAPLAYHALFFSLLMAATFIDYDLQIIPDSITVTGMVLGLAIGAIVPEVRLDPSASPAMPVTTHLRGLSLGIQGLVIGGGFLWAFRFLAGLAFRREAMGFGDVTLIAMIGAFLGWQAAILTFFLGPFFGLAHALGKALRNLLKWITGRKTSRRDHEMPFGPYLSMAAVSLMLAWPWVWGGWGRGLFQTFGQAVTFFTTGEGLTVSRLGEGSAMGSPSPYRRRKRSWVRKLWVYRRLVALGGPAGGGPLVHPDQPRPGDGLFPVRPRPGGQHQRGRHPAAGRSSGRC